MKEIKILNYPWHIAHQYELMKIPATKWTWLIQHRRPFGTTPRGDLIEKYKINFVPYYESGKYDVVLQHLDQQCFEEPLWDKGKGSLFREVSSIVKDTPKICIMHGTPYYPEMFSDTIVEDEVKAGTYTRDQIGMSKELIRRFHEAVKDFKAIVFNSHKAQKQWGFENDPRAVTIWHGLDQEEWFDLPKEPRVVTMISNGGLDMYYDRLFLKYVKEALEEQDILHCHITVDAAFKNFDEYRTFLGHSLVYFNPTRESPMPRARTEAMLSGCCVVTTPHQDADMFIKSGENGILVTRSPGMVAKLIAGLIFDYKNAITIGQAGKKTALELFSGERYRKEWRELLEKVIGGE